MKSLLTLSACLILLMSPAAYAADAGADAIVGQWYTDGQESVVEIYKSGSLYSGKIIWLNEPSDEDGNAKTDRNNPDESLRSREIIGLDIVRNFRFDGKNKWSGGTIYDPNSGKTYSCKAKLKGNELNLRGFIGVSLLGRTTIWVRKAADSSE